MKLQSEFLVVAGRVFHETMRPMRPKEIVKYAKDKGMFSDNVAGKTPEQTMKSKLSVHIRRFKEQSPFVRTGKGLFYLRSLLNPETSPHDAEPLAKPDPKEFVLVFDTHLLEQGLRFQGIKADWETHSKSILESKVCRYIYRLDAEQNQSVKQVITYIMVTRGDQVLVYKRGSYNLAADFLRGSYCIGFGGHVSMSDMDMFNEADMGLFRSAARELGEELELPELDQNRLAKGKGLTFQGIINDDSSEVGQRHMAFVLRYEVSSDPDWEKPKRGEKSITQLRWIGPTSFPTPIWEFEYWSQLCFRQFFRHLVSTNSSFRIMRRIVLQPPNIMCIVGTVGSGKSKTTGILRDDFGYTEVNSGRVLAELLGIPPVPATSRAEFQVHALNFVSKDGGLMQLADV